MKWVHLVEFDAQNREGKVVATFVLEDGKIRGVGNEALLSNMHRGIFSPFENKRVTGDDGEIFLNALPVEFRNAYLFATDVQEGDKILPYQTPPMHKIP